mmetsp:Transcript_113926/g.302741  ORF Transcript_113926/g.302741 Transcript_113926/m.302741 type:complete len:212 (-) Transcript_113926:19-654(-)
MASSAAVGRDANLWVVRVTATTKGHSCSLDHLLNEVAVLDRFQRTKLSTEGAAAAEEVLEPSDLGGGLRDSLHLPDRLHFLHRRTNMLLVRCELRVQLHEGFHGAALLEARLDGRDAGAVAGEHGVGRQLDVAVAALHANVDLPALEAGGTPRPCRCPERPRGLGEEQLRRLEAKRKRNQREGTCDGPRPLQCHCVWEVEAQATGDKGKGP